jgi:hypothetical protein
MHKWFGETAEGPVGLSVFGHLRTSDNVDLRLPDWEVFFQERRRRRARRLQHAEQLDRGAPRRGQRLRTARLSQFNGADSMMFTYTGAEPLTT